MKRSNYIFESVLIVITAVLGFAALFSFDAVILGALWVIALGALQVIHSLILAASYWSNEAIQKSIIIYWCGVALNFSLMLIGNAITDSENVEMATILVFPLILALYLWYITCTYRAKPAAGETVEKE